MSCDIGVDFIRSCSFGGCLLLRRIFFPRECSDCGARSFGARSVGRSCLKVCRFARKLVACLLAVPFHVIRYSISVYATTDELAGRQAGGRAAGGCSGRQTGRFTEWMSEHRDADACCRMHAFSVFRVSR